MADPQVLNNGFGPVSQKRGHMSWYAAVVVALSIILAIFMGRVHVKESPITQEMIIEDALQLTSILSCLLLCEFLRRLCLYAEERNHIDTRYKGDSKKAIYACIGLNHKALWICTFLLTTGVSCYHWYYDANPLFGPETYVYTLFVYLVVACVLEAKTPSKVELSQLYENNNKFVADGLAWSYYFGYLKLILPNFKAMIGDAISPEYEHNGEDYRELLSSQKLFVLIPKNCWCPPKIAENNSRIQSVGSMPSQRRTRGGVQEREYKNTLYELTTAAGRKEYLIMENATPILAMHEMSDHAAAAFSKDDRDEQVVQFYNKLKDILDSDHKCKDSVQLVLLGDPNVENVEETIIEAIDNPKVE